MFDWLTFAVGSQFIAGTSSVFDRILLRRKFFDPWVYTFWLGLVGGFALVLVPFGFALLPLKIILLCFAAGAALMLSIFLLYSGLVVTEASETIPFIGGLSPIFTLVLSSIFLEYSLDLGQIIGFVFLGIATLILFFAERKVKRLSLLIYAVGSALGLGFYLVLAKIVFENTAFINGFIWLKLGAIAFVLILLLIPRLRKRFFAETGKAEISNNSLYFMNRAYAGLGSLLFSYALFLSQPALVDATQSFKYIVVFFAGWLLLRERFRGRALLGKIVALIFIAAGLIMLGSVEYGRGIAIDPNRPLRWGVTFSQKFSEQLNLNWRENFTAIVDDLRPKKIRLVAYWDKIEKNRTSYDFSDLDWQLNQVRGKGIKIILTLGMKAPRWPECHIPEWAKNLKTGDREIALRDYIEILVNRYKNDSVIEMWQVENEPFLMFGKCPSRGEKFLEEEVKILKNLDGSRPVLITDGGEFGLWHKAAAAGDVFGTTMYRKAYPRFIGPILGPIDYHIDPKYFPLKERAVRWLTRDYEKKFIVIELQAEPWGAKEIPELTYEEQIALFSPDYFRDTIEYAKQTGFEDYYLWGAEWWYLLKEKHNDPLIWEEAKKVISNN